MYLLACSFSPPLLTFSSSAELDSDGLIHVLVEIQDAALLALALHRQRQTKQSSQAQRSTSHHQPAKRALANLQHVDACPEAERRESDLESHGVSQREVRGKESGWRWMWSGGGERVWSEPRNKERIEHEERFGACKLMRQMHRPK